MHWHSLFATHLPLPLQLSGQRGCGELEAELDGEGMIEGEEEAVEDTDAVGEFDEVGDEELDGVGVEVGEEVGE